MDIRTIRQRFGFSPEDLASALGVSVRSVWRWENGAQPGRLAAREITRFLNEVRETPKREASRVD